MQDYWWDLSEISVEGHDEIMEHSDPLRQLAKMGQWKLKLWAVDGEMEKALEGCLSLIKVGHHLAKRKITIEHLVGVLIMSLGERTLLEILAHRPVAAQLLAKTQEALQSVYAQGFPLLDSRGEGLFEMGMQVDVIQERGMTDFRTLFMSGTGIFLGTHGAFEDKILTFCERIDRRSPYDKHLDKKSEPGLSMRLPELIIYMLGPSVGRIYDQGHRGRALHEASLAVLALHRWRLDRGQYPQGLGELVEGDTSKGCRIILMAPGRCGMSGVGRTLCSIAWRGILTTTAGRPILRIGGDWRVGTAIECFGLDIDGSIAEVG